jgi:hypothetical protein
MSTFIGRSHLLMQQLFKTIDEAESYDTTLDQVKFELFSFSQSVHNVYRWQSRLITSF